MIMETNDSFSFEEKEKADLANPKVREWEDLMWKYQQAIPGGARGAKWRVMERIFWKGTPPIIPEAAMQAEWGRTA